MLGHRTLNVEDYLSILKRRWWMIALPAVLFPIVAYAITFFIQPTYVSQTLVLIEQQRVPNDFVPSVVNENLDSRLASMKEQILSRSSIQPIIEKYNLYANQHLSMDGRIDLARTSIDIKPIHSDISRSDGLPGFFIYFTANDPHTAQLVCGEVQSLFVKQSLLSREATVNETTAFLRNQLQEAKHTLDDQDAKLAAFQEKNSGRLPSDEGNNMNILGTLDTQLDAVTQSVQTMEQNKSVIQAMLAQQSAAQSIGPSASPSQAPQVQQLELDRLQAEEADLATHYQPDYPDLKTVRRKIADLRKQMANPAPAPEPSSASTPSYRPDSASVQQLRAQLRGLELAIDSKHKQQDQLTQQIHSYQARVQSTPQVEAEYKELTRGSQTAQSFYDSLQVKLNQSNMGADLEHRQQGETFRVMDEPNLPDGPTHPKKSVFVGAGLAFGVGLGLLVIAFLEYKDTALRSERDIWAFTQLPTLAVIAWSGDVAHIKNSRTTRMKRLFSRKPPKEMLADGLENHV
jgi:polysaccharide chain length determinant protein (PEP-CTERM system associated)